MAREMKDSGVAWIGEIPSTWSIQRMKNCIASRQSGAWGDDATGETGDAICLRIADFDYARFHFKETSVEDLTVRHYAQDVIERLKLAKGDILIEKSGGGEKTPVGRTVIFDKDYTALYANFMDCLRCTSAVYPQFMQYVFVTFYKNDYSRNYIKQTTGIQNLDLTAMLATEAVATPPIEEQICIATFLDRKCAEIDSVIAKTQRTIEEYKVLKQSIITEAVTKGIRGERPMKDSGIQWIGDIPEEWNTVGLKFLCRMQSGKNITSEMIADEGAYPVYGGNGLRGYYSEYNTEGEYLLVGRQGALCGNVHHVAGQFWATEHAVVTTPTMLADIDYLYYLLIGMNLNQYANNTAAQPGLAVGQIQNVRTCFVPLAEQQEIASYLNKKCAEIEKLIAGKTHLLEELESYKKSVIYEYVTGKKEVPACQ